MAAKRTVRSEVLDAFVRLEARTGRDSFSVGEVAHEVHLENAERKRSTLQTYVSSVMCADAPKHHANHTDDLARTAPGRYRRIVPWEGADLDAAGHRPGPVQPTPDPTTAREEPAARHVHWAWEGNVQSAVASALAGWGWQLRSIADTASRAHGADVVAERLGRRLQIEVKGYPEGAASAATQARTYFGGALLTLLLVRDADPDAVVVMAVPHYPTYVSLVDRTSGSLEHLGIGVLLVDAEGHVTEKLPPAGGSLIS